MGCGEGQGSQLNLFQICAPVWLLGCPMCVPSHSKGTSQMGLGEEESEARKGP